MRLLIKVLRIEVIFSSRIIPGRLNLDLLQSSNMTPENKHQCENLLLSEKTHGHTLEFHSFVFKPRGPVISKLRVGTWEILTLSPHFSM